MPHDFGSERGNVERVSVRSGSGDGPTIGELGEVAHDKDLLGIELGLSTQVENLFQRRRDLLLAVTDDARLRNQNGVILVDLAHAIEYAVEMGACIVNLAYGADLAATGVPRAIQYAATRNALVVTSADHVADAPLAPEQAPNTLRVLAVMIAPVMPAAAARLWEQLGLPGAVEDQRVPDALAWGGLPPGTATVKGSSLFPRLPDED